MAYRGSVARNPPPNKKPPSFTSNQSGFESQFSDLSAFSACPPNSKRPRTNTGGRQNFNTAAKNKTPLKFDFRSTKTNDNKIIPPPAPSSSSSHQRYVSKPVLASQMPPKQQTEGDGFGDSQDDWGEDGDDALLLAASQMVEPVDAKVETNEEELLAMTAMLEDDDFGLDDVAGLEAAALEMEQEERLNQTVTVFNCPPSQSTSTQVFRQPPPPQPTLRGQIEVTKAKEEQERLKKLHMKAQGEASFLRSELGKQSKEIEGERISKRKLEAELKSKLEAERKLKENEMSAMKTEKLFLVQEMQQLKEKLKQMESEVKREGSVGTPRSRKVLGQIKVERNDFPTEREFQEKKFKSNQSNAETQTKEVKRRKCLLRRSMDKEVVMVQSFCRVSTASSGVKARILQQTTREAIIRGVGRTVAQLTAEINTSLPTPPSATQLANMSYILSSCGSLITQEDRTAITETCSNLLSWMIKSASCSLLSPTLSLLTMAWSSTLLDQDITSFILSLLSELIRTVKALSEELSPTLMRSVFSLVLLVSRDPAQAGLLCKQGQDCFLSCIYLVLHMSLTKEQEVQVAACKGLVNWLLACSAVTHPVSWMDNSCRWCTGDIVRTLTLTTQSQVRWQVDKMGQGEGEKDVELLRECVTALGRLQDNLRSEGGEEVEWIKAVEVAASVQRKYIWTVEKLLKMDLGQGAAMKLSNLAMETDMGPEGERGENMDIE